MWRLAAGAGVAAGATFFASRNSAELESRHGASGSLHAAPSTARLPPTHERVCDSVLSAIGNTPLVEIRSLSQATGCRIVAKAEWMNPGGSIKDRPALYLVEAAEQAGQLKPGGTIVEVSFCTRKQISSLVTCCHRQHLRRMARPAQPRQLCSYPQLCWSPCMASGGVLFSWCYNRRFFC
jgi:hypothetical protein